MKRCPTWSDLKPNFRRRLEKIIRNCDESIAICQSWNDNRSEHSPMDCEPERIIRRTALACLGALNRDDRNLHARLSHELAEYAEKVLAEEVEA